MNDLENLVPHQNITQQFANSLEKCNVREPRLKYLFNRFSSIFGYSWTSTIAGPEELLGKMLEWEEVINDLTDEQIEAGIRGCKYTSEFAVISQFRKHALNIHPPAVAFAMINDDELAKKAWSLVDGWAKKTGTSNDIKNEFTAIYSKLADGLLMRKRK